MKKSKKNAYLAMCKRNILLFFRNKSTMFFSMLAPLIVLGLYVLFLKNFYVESIMSKAAVLGDLIKKESIDTLANAWLLSGVLGTSCITVSLNSLTVMVEDKFRKVDYDYNSSPISGPLVVLAYFTGAFINTLLITCGILLIGLVCLTVIGNLSLSFTTILMLFLSTVIGCASSTIIMMVVVSFFKKTSTLGAFAGIVSAAVGFVIGAYIPLGGFSPILQSALCIVPGSHIASLYRYFLMEGILSKINQGIGGIDSGEFVKACRDLFAIRMNFFSFEIESFWNILYVSVTSVLALIINLAFYKTAMKRRG